jgi:transcriptional regulator with XRE-family HTH domain
VPSTPIERLATPLRKLRVTLGEFGAPLSQEELASRTKLSLATVRAIENERRELSLGVLGLIQSKLWADWDPTVQEWRPLWDKTRFYTKEDGQAAAKFWPKDFSIRKLMIRNLQERIRAICESAAPQDLPGEVMRLNALLGDFARKSGRNVDLAPTEPVWKLGEKEPAGEGAVIQPMLRPEYPATMDRVVQKRTRRTKK